jgi:hypothetical protein
MFQLNDLTQADTQNIFAGLMELPAKIANPLLQKLDAQINLQNRAIMAKQIEEANKAAGITPAAPKVRKSKVAKTVAETVSTPAQGGEDENSQD